MQIAAIPTKYRDVQFRSRLEAKWAAFFDGLAAPWSYEPVDLHGWIPDFRIGDALIDVKPARTFDAECGQKIQRAMGERRKGRESAGYVLGDHPLPYPDAPHVFRVGWSSFGIDLAIAELAGHGFAFLIGPPPMLFPAIGFPCWASLTVDCLDGRLRVDLRGGQRIAALWALACNATQWRAPR